MTSRALTLASDTPAAASSRGAALRARAARLCEDERIEDAALQGLTLALIDALLSADVEALDAVTAPLGRCVAQLDERAAPELQQPLGWLRGLLSVAHWGIERLPGSDEAALRAGSLAARFLTELERHAPQTSSDLRRCLQTTETQVSRCGRQLLAAAFVVQRKSGRFAHWELTPRGRQALALMRAAEPHAGGIPALTGRAGRFMKAEASAPTSDTGRSIREPASASGSAGTPSAQHERIVLPDQAGSWTVSGSPDGQVERWASKREAVTRARESLASAGGGALHVHDRHGQHQKSVRVRPRRRP